MLDEIYSQLYMRTATGRWTTLEELNESIESQGLERKEAEDVMSFLKEYFIELDESREKAKLNPWFFKLFEISSP